MLKCALLYVNDIHLTLFTRQTSKTVQLLKILRICTIDCKIKYRTNRFVNEAGSLGFGRVAIGESVQFHPHVGNIKVYKKNILRHMNKK